MTLYHLKRERHIGSRFSFLPVGIGFPLVGVFWSIQLDRQPSVPRLAIACSLLDRTNTIIERTFHTTDLVFPRERLSLQQDLGACLELDLVDVLAIPADESTAVLGREVELKDAHLRHRVG